MSKVRKLKTINTDLDLIENLLARVQDLEQGQLLKDDFSKDPCVIYLKSKGRAKNMVETETEKKKRLGS